MASRAPILLLLLGCLLAWPAWSAATEPTKLSISVRGKTCSALLLRPAEARALLVLAHGQAMDIDHPFMASLSEALAAKRVATLRFNFPYAEAKQEKLDGAPLLLESMRAAVLEGRRQRGSLPLLAGGKSMGGSIAALATHDDALPDVEGVVILGYPLHAPGRPSALNARRIERVPQRMLIVQGSRDALADLTLMRAIVERIGARATLHVVPGADHNFALSGEDGTPSAATYEEIAGVVAAFVASIVPPGGE